MKLNEIRDNSGAHVERKRVGRGISSGTGKTSGKGMKGQKSRSGVSLVGFEGGQMPLYRRLPKRGFKNPFSKEIAPVNLGSLQKAVDEKKIDAKKPVTEAVLADAGIARVTKDGMKLLAKGEISTKLTIEISNASKSAIEAIEKAGGSVVLPTPKPKPVGKGKKHEREKSAKLAKAENPAKAATDAKAPAAEDAES
ncbi:MAG: 50S ribosomal protein L15 [Rhodospirillales bacterium]|nr:50S ribosomal protein L15 [Rhodospirillales bacterium]